MGTKNSIRRKNAGRISFQTWGIVLSDAELKSASNETMPEGYPDRRMSGYASRHGALFRSMRN